MSEPRDEFPDVKDIDKLIHEPARLILMANLYVVESADFLRARCYREASNLIDRTVIQTCAPLKHP